MFHRFLFEFEDQSWLPAAIREGMTDFLRFIFSEGKLYQPIAPLLANALQQANAGAIVDLCSGSGGPVEQVTILLAKQGITLPVTLTDKFPNIPAFELLQVKSNSSIKYISYPVDATKVPRDIKGFRTIFSGFHHFDKQSAKAILHNAMQAKEGIAVFDGGNKNLLFILAILLLQPLVFFLCTPFIKPFSWSKIIFTYLLPLIPLCTIWDGTISILRLYTAAELLAIAEGTGETNYCWQAGKVKNKWGMSIAYLTGYPVSNTNCNETYANKTC